MQTKTCTKCNQEKTVEQFRVRNKSKGWYSPWCKACFSLYEKEKWTTDPTRRTTNIIRNRDRKVRNREYLWRYLEQNPCVQCGEDDPRVLEFDHIDREQKSFTIGDSGSQTHSLEKIKREIAKCRVLCANCHRRHTYQQLGWRTF